MTKKSAQNVAPFTLLRVVRQVTENSSFYANNVVLGSFGRL